MIRLYKDDGSNVDLCRRQNIEQGKRIVSPDTEGAKLLKELMPEEASAANHDQLLQGHIQALASQEWIMYKPRWGAFYQTGLESFLKKRSITTVAVAGCNFPNCPRTTIYEASERDFRTVLIKDAVSGLYKRAEQELRNIGVTVLGTREMTTGL